MMSAEGSSASSNHRASNHTASNHGASSNRDAYRQAFVTNVHVLLQLGHQRLDPSTFAGAQETAITGALVKSIQDVMDSAAAPSWVDSFSVSDDPPIEDGKRTGRSRFRVDILFESTVQRPRPKMAFEAKRLSKTNTLGEYLGPEGLGCFLRGEYGADHSDAGMLGYIQSGTLEQWWERLHKELNAKAAAVQLTPGTSIERVPFPDGPPLTHQTLHDRPVPIQQLTVYHTLLLFC